MTTIHASPSGEPGRKGQDAEPMEGCVLVVDDELPNRAYLRKLLAGRGCSVVQAESGEQALRMAGEQSPDLILVDVMMPGMTGYETCQRLKSDAKTRDIPVIMVTARVEIEDIETGFDAGAFDYIRKPFNPRELIVRVRNALALKRSKDDLTRWKNKMSRELEVAGFLQRKLLATTPLLSAGFEIRMAYQPCMAIGGDVFDAIRLPRGGLCVYVGDVAGHGVGSAMVASLLKVIITEVVLGYADQGPAAVCREIDERFRRNVGNPEIYATLFLALYDPAARIWRCVNCGHPEPLIWRGRAGGAALPLSGPGLFPVGFAIRDAPLRDAAVEIVIPAEPDSCFLIYTDGLSEAFRENREDACGVDGLAAALAQTAREARGAIPDQLLQRLRADGYQLDKDDCSALVVQCLDPAALLVESRIPPDKKAVAELAESCEKALREIGWGELAAGAVRLLVMEYGINVVDHGRLFAGEQISVQLRRCGTSCRILFWDRGREWDADGRLALETLAPPDSERGRGWDIIKTIAGRAEVIRRDDENVGLFEVSSESYSD